MSVPDVVGTPAQSALAFSSWQDAEQPSPSTLAPSSHSSGRSAAPSPQSGGNTHTHDALQRPGQSGSFPTSQSWVGPTIVSPQTGESASTCASLAFSSAVSI